MVLVRKVRSAIAMWRLGPAERVFVTQHAAEPTVQLANSVMMGRIVRRSPRPLPAKRTYNVLWIVKPASAFRPPVVGVQWTQVAVAIVHRGPFVIP